MSLIKSEMTEKNRYELEFSVDHDTFEAAINKVYRKSVKNINVPGFRKGKAPRSIIEKMYGTGTARRLRGGRKGFCARDRRPARVRYRLHRRERPRHEGCRLCQARG